MDLKKLLLECSQHTGVSGREDEIGHCLTNLAQAYGPCRTTPLGSILCTLRPAREGRPHVMLAAHMDEVGFVVTQVEDRGFLQVAPCGGIDRKLLIASAVVVHTQSGPVEGVFCSTPPHLQKGDKKAIPKVDELYIDIGCEGDSARELVRPGDPVTYLSHSVELMNGQVCGKALDDRACCVALLRTAELLEGQELDCGISLVFTTMEEMGSQGAKTAAWSLQPTHAIALDVSFAHTPDAKKSECGLLGKGPMVGIAPILSRTISDRLQQLAKEQDIPFQVEVMSRSTGTDADCIAVTGGGVATGLLSIPQKYMHTPVEVVTEADVENTARLLAAWLRDL